MIEFTIHTIPIAQPRVKATIRGKHAGVYTPSGPIHSFKAQLRIEAASVHHGELLSGPVSVELVFVFPRTKGQIWKRRDMPRIRHTKKPDADNLAKAVLDSLNGLIWVDDAQVCELSVSKWIAAGDERAGVTVRIYELAHI